MNTYFAPGPWKVKGSSIQAIDHGTYFSIAKVGNAKLSAQEVAGTAQLIAAAPAMSQTLQRCAYVLAELPDQSPQLLALRAEIIACIRQATPRFYGV